MQIKATVTMIDGSIKIMLKNSWHSLTLWMAEHHGEFSAIDARVWPTKEVNVCNP